MLAYRCRVKPGVSHGRTDDLGQRAIENIHPLYHFNATILHLLDSITIA